MLCSSPPFEATLHGQSEYTALFRDARTGQAWLPPDALILTRYEDAQMRFFATFEEDIDVLTTSSGGYGVGAVFDDMGGRASRRKSGASWPRRVCSWAGVRALARRRLTLTLPPGFAVPPNGELVLSLAGAEVADQPIDLSVEVRDGRGKCRAASQPFSFPCNRNWRRSCAAGFISAMQKRRRPYRVVAAG
ncbi:MAG: hypothetical protein H6662_14075 [Ardenticatenaceae bacterium]|nr:hypothetical protein [Ardenticatenaceae bacterium]